MQRIGLVMILCAVVSGCGSGHMNADYSALAVPAGSQAVVTYKNDVLPIFQNVCSGCHNASSAIPNWLDYNVAFNKRELIYQKVVVDKTMPMGKTMLESERALIGAWVKGGGLYEAPGGSDAPAPAPTSTPTVTPTSTVTPPPAGTPITYVGQILPLVQEKCATCHNASSAVPNWLDYGTAYAKRVTIRDRIFVRRDMPLIGTLTDAQRKMVADWVDAGAPYDSGNTTPPPAPSPTSTVLPPLTYDDLMKPRIFGTVCVACHNAQTKAPNWQDYNTVCDKIDKIYEEVVVKKTMPRNMPFADSERKLMADWIRAGAPRSKTSGACERLR